MNNMNEFAMDVELVGGPGCGATVTEIPEDIDTFPYKYSRMTRKGEVIFEAIYKADADTGRAYYLEG
jgi:hypothetical protein